MNRKVEVWNDKDIAKTLAEPGAIRTSVGRKIWSKLPRKTWVKKLVNKSGCLKHHVLFNRKPMQFLKHKSLYWCIDWYWIQFWLHYFGCTVIYVDLNLERLLKNELQ